jgi:hypothetical protein
MESNLALNWTSVVNIWDWDGLLRETNRPPKARRRDWRFGILGMNG